MVRTLKCWQLSCVADCGGSARMVEKALGVEGESTLYVGDHIYTVSASAHSAAGLFHCSCSIDCNLYVLWRVPGDRPRCVDSQDAALAKLRFRWRTALIVRELEKEVRALVSGRGHRQKLKVDMPSACLLPLPLC